MRLCGNSSSIVLRRLATLAVGLFGGLALLIGVAGPASAYLLIAKATPTCATDHGSWGFTLTVFNDHGLPATISNVSGVAVPGLDGAVIPVGETKTYTVAGISLTTPDITLAFSSSWGTNPPFTASYSVPITKPTGCVMTSTTTAPTTTPTTVSTTTATTPAPTTSVTTTPVAGTSVVPTTARPVVTVPITGLPPTGAVTGGTIAIGAAFLAAGALLLGVNRRGRRAA